ncbi:DUF5378 family protein [Mycoplasmoides alvi]|uniref:DUF5378 family protein n=1 Tax=Mycoplasmoides alvi TaxID=78580 RepID=UPI0012EB3D67|nr:DUF5378 family protein [Mycoplasmoides alvi]
MFCKIKNKYRPWLNWGISFQKENPTSYFSFLKKTDYWIWFVVSFGFFIWLFGAYWVVIFIEISEFSSASKMAIAHGGMHFIWNPNKILSNGYVGGFDAIFANNDQLPEEQSTLMPFVMHQFNVSRIIFNLIYQTLAGTDSYFFSLPNSSDPTLQNIAIDQLNTDYNNLYNSLLQINKEYIDSNTYNVVHSLIYSAIFVTPLCQFLSIALPISIICSYKKDYASTFSTWGSIGGFVVIYGVVVGNNNLNVTWQFIFFDEQFFFGYHLYLLFTSISWLVYTSSFHLKHFLSSNIFIWLYGFWVLFSTNIFGIDYFTTGFTKLDFSSVGTYNIVYSLTKLPFPLISILMFIFFIFTMNLIILIKNTIHLLYVKKSNNYDQYYGFLHEFKDYWNKVKVSFEKK